MKKRSAISDKQQSQRYIHYRQKSENSYFVKYDKKLQKTPEYDTNWSDFVWTLYFKCGMDRSCFNSMCRIVKLPVKYHKYH